MQESVIILHVLKDLRITLSFYREIANLAIGCLITSPPLSDRRESKLVFSRASVSVKWMNESACRAELADVPDEQEEVLHATKTTVQPNSWAVWLLC